MKSPVLLATTALIAANFMVVSPSSTFACPAGGCPSNASKSSAESADGKKIASNVGVKETSDSSFKADVLEAKQPVLVDFYAPWCGTCKKMGPVVEKLSKVNEGKIAVIKVNVDKNPQLASQYGIQAIPAIKLFKDGKVVEESTGLASAAELQGKIDRAM